MALLLVLMGGCNGCHPQLPDQGDTEDPPEDSAPPVDTHSGETGDTGPPARCDREEREPNDTLAEIETLEMELWACGTFDHYIDLDWFTITPTQPGWIKIQVEAALRGSSANPQVQVVSEGDSALVLDGYLTTDPLLVFPAEEAESYRINLAETNFLYGEDYSWFMLTSLAKEPVDWSAEEVEPNDSVDEAEVFPVDGVVLSSIASASDLDWYKITTPYEGEQTLTFNVTAFKEGSPANLVLVLYDADGTTSLRTRYSGQIDYDRDPWFEKKITGVQDLYLLARTEDGRGSRFHWYTLEITATPIE